MVYKRAKPLLLALLALALLLWPAWGPLCVTA